MTDPPDTSEALLTDRSRLHRSAQRGHYDRETMYSIVDAQPVCHLGYVRDGGPVVTPTMAWREDDKVFWHGSHASQALRASDDHEVCLTFTIVDGMVLARSGLHHSVNFRSAMLFGTARTVTDADEKSRQLDLLLERILPGQSNNVRPITAKELAATRVQWMPIEEGSVKVRSGGVVDEEEDYELPIWAGVVPLTTTIGAAIPDPRNLPGVHPPAGIDQMHFA